MAVQTQGKRIKNLTAENGNSMNDRSIYIVSSIVSMTEVSIG